MKKLLLLSNLLLYSIIINAQPTIQWQKSLGGPSTDKALCIQQTTDGGYIAVGYSNSANGDVTGYHGGTDGWIIKIDALGILQWQKALGGSGYDAIQSIQQTSDSGYIVAGLTLSNDGDVNGNHGSYDYWIIKLNSNGVIQWQKTLGGTDSEKATSIKQTSDGGYIIAGFTLSNNGDVSGNHGNGNYDYWIVKLYSNGSIQWQKSLGGTNSVYG